MSRTPFKMKGWSGYQNSPLKQTDTTPDWSMSAKHFKKDVGYGSRSRTNSNQMQDNKYYYTYFRYNFQHPVVIYDSNHPFV